MAKAKAPKEPKKPKTYNDYGLKKTSVVIGKKPDGSPDRKYVYYKTRAERDEKLAEIRRKYALGLSQEDITVEQWSERWLSVRKANATDTQKAHYKAKLKHDILPYIGGWRIKDVKATDLQEILNAHAGGKKGTVEKIRQAIRQLFDDAELDGYIERNPAARLDLHRWRKNHADH